MAAPVTAGECGERDIGDLTPQKCREGGCAAPWNERCPWFRSAPTGSSTFVSSTAPISPRTTT